MTAIRPDSRSYWVLHHVNSSLLFGRFDRRWTRTNSLGSAALFSSESEAINALQALKQEAQDRVARSNEHWPSQMWWDIHGGLVVVEEVEQIARIVDHKQGDDQ